MTTIWVFLAGIFPLLETIRLTTDSDGKAYLLNSNIQFVLPSQLPGTALYDTPDLELPFEELVSSPYRLNSQQLLQSYFSSKRIFSKQADGSYTDNSGTLT